MKHLGHINGKNCDTYVLLKFFSVIKFDVVINCRRLFVCYSVFVFYLFFEFGYKDETKKMMFDRFD